MTRSDKLRLRLLRHLEHRGWACTAREARRDDWRVGEVWELESAWSPRGLRAWLLLLNHGYGGKELSYVAVCAKPPVGFQADTRVYANLRVGGGKRAFDEVLARLVALRDSPADEAAGPPSVWDDETWTASADAGRMLEFVHGKLSDRKLRLFACACCRRLPLVTEVGRNLRAVEAAEHYADGLVPKRDLKKARKVAGLGQRLTSFEPFDEALQAVQLAAQWTPPAQQRQFADVLRDVAGNPFRPVTLRYSWRAWQGGTVVKLAQAIYDERRFEDLPVLADALEDAGCADPAVLAHCRGPGEHVRGCWLLDGLLGKA
jgi:hypothetical protein